MSQKPELSPESPKRTFPGLKMHQRAKVILIVFISVLCVCEGAIHLSCDKVDPVWPSTLTCTCRYPNGAGILWYRNDMHVTDCYLDTKFCLPRRHPGYSFSVNKSTNEYILSLFPYNYSNCDIFTCRDISTPDVNDSKSIAARDSTSISTVNISEPKMNHTSGVLRITTEWIYGTSPEVKYLDIQWLVVMGGITKPFRPNNISIVALDRSCQQCDGDKATQFAVSFDHEEKMGCQGNEVKFRIILRYSKIHLKPLNTTTKNHYCITDETSDGSTSSESNKSDTVIITILSLFPPQYIGLVTILIYIFLKTRKTPPGRRVFNMFNENQAKFLLSSCFPVLGIIGIICFHVSSRITEGTYTSENREELPSQNKMQPPRAHTPPPRPPALDTPPPRAPTPPPTAPILPPADMEHQRLDQNFKLANVQGRDGYVKLIKLLVGVMIAQLNRSQLPENERQNFIEFEKQKVLSALFKVNEMMNGCDNSEQSADYEDGMEKKIFLNNLGISKIQYNILTQWIKENVYENKKSLPDLMFEANEEPGNSGTHVCAATPDDDQVNARLLGTINSEKERENPQILTSGGGSEH